MSAASRARRLVLVVDDQDPNRFAKAQILRRANYEVCEATNGHDALRVAADRDPDLVLLDVHLPDISGLEVCRRLKAEPRTVPIAVLQVSATAISDAERATGLENGADAYLTEPVSSEVLLATMRALDRVRQLEAELAAANRLKDEFLAVLSHELRTPLNVMLGRIAQLRDVRLPDDVRERAIDALERSARHQWQLVDELLDVARIEKGKLELQLADVDLADVVRGAVDAMTSRAAAGRVELRADIHSAPVSGDANRLQQVVTNLVGNAVQFTPPGGLIRVSLSASGREVQLSVADTGVGIDAELLPHIFERFRQSSDPQQRGHRGLGLGLAISAGIVEAHGGRLAAASEGTGRGSTFTVVLPRRA
ncbi:MAG TPA: hybrid sensor histidine kinase/response regulator [Vicinamibacterales bacterium]|nr:hybrid sensor histidine kinase/response regulator [Vicinamibacterales bacterium]